MSDLGKHFNKSQGYLKLGDKETFEGLYIGWEAIKTKFGKNGYRITLERDDGSRVSWDTGNGRAILQLDSLIDKGLKKGSPITILREGTEKDNTKYTISEGVPF